MKIHFNHYCTCLNILPEINLCEYCLNHLKKEEILKWKDINEIIDNIYQNLNEEKSKILVYGEVNKVDIEEINSKSKGTTILKSGNNNENH